MKKQDGSHRIRCNRRRFFPLLLQEILVTLDSANGTKPGHRLSELSDLPDEQLFDIKPVMNPDYQIFVHEGYVCARRLPSEDDETPGKEYALFPLEQQNLTVFNNFNGKLSLGEIRDLLVQKMQWDAEQATAHVRELFLALAARLICMPKNPVDEQA